MAPITTLVDLVLTMKTGRSISDTDWQVIDAAHIEVWEQAKSLLATREFTTRKGTVRLEFDWSPVLARLRQNFKIMTKLYSTSEQERYNLRFPQRPIRVPCRAIVSEEEGKYAGGAQHSALSVAQSYLHDVFIIINLAAPGACCLWPANLRLRQPEVPVYDADLDLSEYSFDNAYMDTVHGDWPPAKMLSLELVERWYRSVRTGINQMPECRMEKAVFALMRICKAHLPIDTFIWLFYALESLFDTQPGENRRALLSRIGLMLSPDEKQRGFLKKKFGELYDIRSGLVHGGHEIAHPMGDEALDPRADTKFVEHMHASEFGFAVLLASIQAAIERGLTELTFRETLVGKGLPP